MGQFVEIDDQRVHDLITTNTFSMIGLTQQIIKSFKSRYLKFGKRSLLCSTSSIAALLPIPNAQIYSGSKLFVDRMS